MRNIRKHGAMCGVVTMILLSACSKSGEHIGAVETPGGGALTSFSQEITSSVHEFEVKAGETYTLDINVKNTGTQPWAGGAKAFSVDAGYRWLDSKGSVLAIEGNRAFLNGEVVKPGESQSLRLQVGAPPSPGSYTLWVSMVQEGVAWFYTQTTKPLALQVTVE